MELYPNPASDRVTVVIPDIFNSAADLVLFNVSGKEVLRTKLADGQQNVELQLVGSDVSAGLYFVRVQSGDKRLTSRLVIVK